MWSLNGKDVAVGSPAGGGRVLKPGAEVWLGLGLPATASLLIGGLAIAPVFWGGLTDAQTKIPLGLALLTVSSLIFAHVLRARTVLFPDRIESRGLLGLRSMQRSEIAGYRLVTSRNRTPAAVLTPKQQDARPLKAYLYGDTGEFKGWRGDLPDLDQRDREATKAQLLANPDLGSSPAEREARLGLLKHIALGFNVLCIAVAVWVWNWPSPHPLAIAALIALIPLALALVWGSKGVITLAASAADPRSNVSLALLSGMLVGLKAMSIGTDQWPVALAIGVALAAGPTFAVYTLNARWEVMKRGFWFAALLFVAWGWGAVMLIDSAADGGRTKVVQTTVLNKTVHHGRSTTWTVQLTPWVDHVQAEYQVSSDIYDQLTEGGTACVGLHPGALGVAWFEVNACPRDSVASASPPPTANATSSAGAIPEAIPNPAPTPNASPAASQRFFPYLALPKAEDMAVLYPAEAQRRSLEGRTRFTCTVMGDGRLTDCVVLSETPPGVGFGAATLRVVQLFRVKPVLPDGSSSAGKKFTNGIAWRLPR